MALLSRAELRELIDCQEGPCVSILLPSHTRDLEAHRDGVRYKNLLKKAAGRLREEGLKARECEALLAPLHDIWSSRSAEAHGLAVFASSRGHRAYWVPLELEEVLVVSDAFHLKPLLPLLTGDGRFYILAISQKNARLFQASKFTMSEIELKDLPASLAESFRFDVFEKSLQHHTSSGPDASGRPNAIFHGHGGAGHDHLLERKLHEHLHQLDTGIQKLIEDHHAPLVLAGVRSLCATYRHASRAHHLMPEGIDGNPEQLDARTLHARALALVAPELSARREKAAATWADLSRSERASTRLETVVMAAYQGRVEILFAAVDREVWGRFLPAYETVAPHEKRDAGDNDLLNLAALYTLYHGGSVYVVPTAEMPAVSPCAAVFRF